jgi:hypothetical protein
MTEEELQAIEAKLDHNDSLDSMDYREDGEFLDEECRALIDEVRRLRSHEPQPWSKFVYNDTERIDIIDRKDGWAVGGDYKGRKTRWILWNGMTQKVVSEHPTLRDARRALSEIS